MIPNFRELRTPTKVVAFAYLLVAALGIFVALEVAYNFGIFMIELVLAYVAFYGVIGFVIVASVYLAVRKLKDIEEGGFKK